MSRETEPVIKRHYLDLLEAMGKLLEDQAFLLGSHPSLVDIALFGPMFRHYAQDPAPSLVMERRAPAVYAWVGRVWNARALSYAGQPVWGSFSHPGWSYFFEDIVQSYWPFLLANARAWKEGKSRIDHKAHGVTYRRLKVVHYRVFCLELLQNEYQRLSDADRESVARLVAPYGRLELIDGLESGLMKDHELPLRAGRPQPSRFQRFKLALTGTPWDMPVKPLQ
jgi:hypothetical protein